MSVQQEYLRDVTGRFGDYRSLAERSFAQVSDEEFFRSVDPESNSIAVVVRHLAGNMRSRWRDFLTTDGEKPDRRRDDEFEIAPATSRAVIMAEWEAAWALVTSELGRLRPEDVERTVMVRHEPMSVVSAINRQLGHTAYHVGQITYLAKHFRSSAWTPLTVPRGRSDEFNEKMKTKFGK
jgi:hypothetical protein